MLQCPSQHGTKVILPLVFKAGDNTKTMTIHIREVHYRMAIVCDVCWSFASMWTQHILDHHSRCKAKCDRECVEQEAQEKAKIPQEEIQVLGRNDTS